MSHFSRLSTDEILIDHAGTPGDPTDDELLDFLSGPSHGHMDAPGLCELARRYAP